MWVAAFGTNMMADGITYSIIYIFMTSKFKLKTQLKNLIVAVSNGNVNHTPQSKWESLWFFSKSLIALIFGEFWFIPPKLSAFNLIKYIYWICGEWWGHELRTERKKIKQESEQKHRDIIINNCDSHNKCSSFLSFNTEQRKTTK